MENKFIHFQLPKRIETISGYYTLTEEKIINILGREVLVYRGYGVVDNSCCGVGGCEYTLVIGIVRKHRVQNGEGPVFSFVKKIEDHFKVVVKKEILKRYPYSQTIFYWE